jgi:hypothetical protein
MFAPKLSAAQGRAVTDLQTRLASALKPVSVDEPLELSRLRAKHDPLAAEIAGIERDANAGNLEERAQILANRKAQEHLVDVRLKELRGKHEVTEAEARNKSAATLAATRSETRDILIQIANDFQDQHRKSFESACLQYVNFPEQANQLVNLFPFFLRYKLAIRHFVEHRVEPIQLLEWLGAALAGRDFLMPTV